MPVFLKRDKLHENNLMEIKYFPLGTIEKKKVVNIIRIAFGVLCILVAAFWISFNSKQLKVDWTLWITIIFLAGFGFYQILSGLGKANTFIEIGPDSIRLKKNSVLPTEKLKADQIERIELFPLNVIFILRSGKKILLRFGTTYQDTNEIIKDEIILFAESKNIPLEIKEEKL